MLVTKYGMSQGEETGGAYNTTGFITGIYTVWQRENAADTRRDIDAGVFVLVDMMKLADQIQIKASIPDNLAPNLGSSISFELCRYRQ